MSRGAAARSALVASRGAGRVVRIATGILLIVWFALPFLPLALWAGADRWSFPSPLPTEWGTRGLVAAEGFGAVPAFLTSVVLALTVAAIATPLGALAARALTFGSVPWPRAVAALLLSPIALPPFAAVLGVNVVLLRTYVPPVAGTVLVLVVLALPYTAFVMRTAYGAYDLSYEENARLLGASRRDVLLHVQVPLLAPALARAAFLAFLVAWSDYLVTVIVGAGELVTLPLVVAGAAAAVGNDAAVAVMSLAAILPPIVLLLVTVSLGRRRAAPAAPAAVGDTAPTPVPERIPA
ncbi:ABC transporter permease [Microbacterium kunmingense]|uniref:ABC transporter permease n=1 Tax=Microbacterium kunmingense TaxID=2915939 RepID=UPI003D75C9EC